MWSLGLEPGTMELSLSLVQALEGRTDHSGARGWELAHSPVPVRAQPQNKGDADDPPWNFPELKSLRRTRWCEVKEF